MCQCIGCDRIAVVWDSGISSSASHSVTYKAPRRTCSSQHPSEKGYLLGLNGYKSWIGDSWSSVRKFFYFVMFNGGLSFNWSELWEYRTVTMDLMYIPRSNKFSRGINEGNCVFSGEISSEA